MEDAVLLAVRVEMVVLSMPAAAPVAELPEMDKMVPVVMVAKVLLMAVQVEPDATPVTADLEEVEEATRTSLGALVVVIPVVEAPVNVVIIREEEARIMPAPDR